MSTRRYCVDHRRHRRQSGQSPAPSAESWDYSTPEKQGFDSDVLLQLVRSMEAEDLDIRSIVLICNDYVFFEVYKYPYGPDTLQHSMSVGKSVTSALTEVALEDGCLPSLDRRILESFPEQKAVISDPLKAEITLRGALTMQAGLAVSDEDDAQVLTSIFENESWIEATWMQDMTDVPGKAFNYSSFVSHLIAQVAQRPVGMDLMDYARKELFDPIGVGQVQIERDPEGNWFGAGGLWMTSRDMLGFGKLYLDKGKWDGDRIVPRRWLRESTRNQIRDQPASANGIVDERYGYQWWVRADLKAELLPLTVPELRRFVWHLAWERPTASSFGRSGDDVISNAQGNVTGECVAQCKSGCSTSGRPSPINENHVFHS